MINHLRTVLLNEEQDPNADEEQYIEPGFHPLPLDSATSAIRSLLIRQDWPRDYRNFVATLLSALTMESPFGPLIDELDARSTIDFSQSLVPTLTDKIRLEKIRNASHLNVLGAFTSNQDAGIFGGQWELTRTSSNTGVTLWNTRTNERRVIDPITFSGDATGLYLVDPDNGLSFQFVGTSSLPDFRAILTATNPKFYNCSTALTRLQSSEDARSVFLSGGPHSATLLKMNQAFEEARRPDHALAAMLTAYCYRITP